MPRSPCGWLGLHAKFDVLFENEVIQERWAGLRCRQSFWLALLARKRNDRCAQAAARRAGMAAAEQQRLTRVCCGGSRVDEAACRLRGCVHVGQLGLDELQRGRRKLTPVWHKRAGVLLVLFPCPPVGLAPGSPPALPERCHACPARLHPSTRRAAPTWRLC